MIGVRTGISCGIRTAVAAGASSDPVSPVGIVQLLLLGDSNAGGLAGFGSSVPAPDQSNPGFNAAATQSTTFVYYDGRVDSAVDNPPVYIEVTGGVQPYPVSGPDHNMGTEITLGLELSRQGVHAVLAKQAIVGLTCAAMVPNPSPAYPSTGPSWHSTLATFAHGLEASHGSLTQIAIVFAGNNDGVDATLSASLATNMGLLASGLVSNFPGLRAIIWIQIHSDTLNFPGFIAGTITNQTGWFAANPTVSGVPVTVVNWDALQLQTDHAHGTPNAYMTLGQWIAWVACDALGLPRPRPTTVPQIVGYGPISAANGSTKPDGWGGAQAGDLEILIDVQMVGSGTEGSTTTPSGWTSRGSVVSATGSPGFQTRLVIYSRVVDSAMLAGNHGHTAASSVALDSPNSLHWSQIITIRGPNANPTVDFVQATGANATGTSYTLTGNTTSGTNRLIIVVNTGFPSPQVATSVTLGSSNVTGVSAIKNGVHACPDGNAALIDIQSGILASAGATGSIAITLGGSNIAPAGAMIAIAP